MAGRHGRELDVSPALELLQEHVFGDRNSVKAARTRP